jgi:hypothetical protein
MASFRGRVSVVVGFGETHFARRNGLCTYGPVTLGQAHRRPHWDDPCTAQSQPAPPTSLGKYNGKATDRTEAAMPSTRLPKGQPARSRK